MSDAQIPLVHRACEALGVPIITQERYEADDVIGTMTVRAANAGYGVAIVTGDKDFFQLVRDAVKVFNPREEGTWYDAAGVKEKFGVAPEQVVDVLALMGDTIDNIKGVPGIGEKTVEKISVAVRHYFGQYEAGEERPIVAGEERPEPAAAVAAEPEAVAAEPEEVRSLEKTPEAILAEEAGTGKAKETNELSAEDIAQREDEASKIDAFSEADEREARIEQNNDAVDRLVNDSQEVSDEGVDDGNERG